MQGAGVAHGGQAEGWRVGAIAPGQRQTARGRRGCRARSRSIRMGRSCTWRMPRPSGLWSRSRRRVGEVGQAVVHQREDVISAVGVGASLYVKVVLLTRL
eukprot:1329354-Prymnesium_polylepis.1